MIDRELLEALLQEIQTIKTQVNKIDNIEQSLQQVHVKLDGITEHVVQNSETLAFVKAQTASNTETINKTNVLIKELQDIEQQQEQTIDLLSRRSIDLEAKLRNLKQ